MARVIRERKQPASSYPRAALRYEIDPDPHGLAIRKRRWGMSDTFGLLLLVILWFAFVQP